MVERAVTDILLYFLLVSLVVSLLGFIIRGDKALDIVAFAGILTLAVVAPESAAWLGASSLTVIAVMHLPEKIRRRFKVSGLVCACLIFFLLAARDGAAVELVAVTYFTLRHIHVLLDWSLGQLETPSLRQYLRYQFFLPVLLAGPIHRYQNFSRQMRRRRPSSIDFFSGLERILIGLFAFIVICNWALVRLSNHLQVLLEETPIFLQLWVAGSFEWLQILSGFGGLSAIAIGLARMMGIVIEENFNRPWMATDLIDFWSRWHITLSSWCRDYVYNFAVAITRRAELAIFAGAIAMGLWHGTSTYYILWGIWQALGIIITYLMINAGWGVLKSEIKPPCMRLLVPVWLSLTKPVCSWSAQLIC